MSICGKNNLGKNLELSGPFGHISIKVYLYPAENQLLNFIFCRNFCIFLFFRHLCCSKAPYGTQKWQKGEFIWPPPNFGWFCVNIVPKLFCRQKQVSTKFSDMFLIFLERVKHIFSVFEQKKKIRLFFEKISTLQPLWFTLFFEIWPIFFNYADNPW